MRVNGEPYLPGISDAPCFRSSSLSLFSPEHHPHLIAPYSHWWKMDCFPRTMHPALPFPALGIPEMTFSPMATSPPYLGHPLGHSPHLCRCFQAVLVTLGCLGCCHRCCRGWNLQAALQPARSASPTGSASAGAQKDIERLGLCNGRDGAGALCCSGGQ